MPSVEQFTERTMNAEDFIDQKPYFKHRNLCLISKQELIDMLKEFDNQNSSIEIKDKQEIKCEKIDPAIVC